MVLHDLIQAAACIGNTQGTAFGEILPALILQEVFFVTGREKDLVIRIQQTEINLADILPVCQAFL